MGCFSCHKSLKVSGKSWKCWKRKTLNKNEAKKRKSNTRGLAKTFKRKRKHGEPLAKKLSLKDEISLSRNKHTSEVPLIRKRKGKNYFCCFGKSKIAESSEDVFDADEYAKSSKSCFSFFRRSKEKKSSIKEKPLEKNHGKILIDSVSCFCCFDSVRCFYCIDSRNMKSSKKMFCWRRKEKKKADNLTSLVETMSFNSDSVKHRGAAEEILHVGNGTLTAQAFTFRELASATDNFAPQNLLGKGGFGKVYKGVFQNTNQVIAVKKLDKNGYQGNREFLVEVLMLTVLNHPNLIKLLGYCADGDERILVYDYMKHGSLEEHLFDLPPNAKPLDWNTRMKIAAGAARGLEHLHDTADPPVIYRDLKVSNILLDEDYNPTLADFGLAKIGPIGPKNHVSTRVMGSFGYCAPEYALTGRLTKKSDIYSFGVVLLELITGRKAMDLSRPRKEQRLVDWAAPRFEDRKNFIELADPSLGGNFPVKALYQALAVAAMCLQEEETNRPLIKDVVFALQFLAMPEKTTAEVKCHVESKGEENDSRDVDDDSMHSFQSFSEAEIDVRELD